VDRATLYVTTTTRDATPDQPHAGAVFAVDTSTRGQAPRYFSVGT
jgi:sugar lactone lactonase YvrE